MSIPQASNKQFMIASEHELRQEHDHVSAQQKTVSIVRSIWHELHYAFTDIVGRCGFSRFYFHQNHEKIVWKTASQGLFVLVHGLNGHPSIWNTHLSELEKFPQYDVFVPYVPFAGRCTLEEAAQPLLNQILDYLKNHPQQPICLIGVSNGSRVATWLEIQLRERAKGTAVKISTIAGVYFGSTLINKLNQYGLAKWILPSVITEELAFGSEKAQKLLEKMIQPCHYDTERSYDFFATTEDALVPCLSSSLPKLGIGEKHYVVHGFGHNSLVKGISTQQLQLCIEWMHRQLEKRLANYNKLIQE